MVSTAITRACIDGGGTGSASAASTHNTTSARSTCSRLISIPTASIRSARRAAAARVSAWVATLGSSPAAST